MQRPHTSPRPATPTTTARPNPRLRACGACALAVAALACAGVLPAREPLPTDRDPPPVEPTPAPAPSGPAASVPNRTLLLPPDFGLPQASRPLEGTLLTAIVGTAVRVQEDLVAFIPDPQTRLGPDPLDALAPPMLLMSNQRAHQLANALTPRGDRARVTIWGETYSYRGLTYALVSTYTLAPSVAPTTPTTPAPIPPTPAAPSTPPPAQDIDASVRALVAELERAQPPAPAPGTAPSRANAANPLEQEQPLVLERTLVVQRRARFVRVPGSGRLAVVFDNDPDSPGPTAMLVQPSTMLEQAEASLAQTGDDASYEVSGRVQTARDRNLLLLTMFRLIQPSDVAPRQ